MIRMDSRAAPSAMLPRATRDLRSAAGAGYLTIFLLEGATAGWGVYGAALVQALYGVNPLVGGYVVGCVAVGWTRRSASDRRAEAARWQGPLIRIGASGLRFSGSCWRLAVSDEGVRRFLDGGGVGRLVGSRVRPFLVIHGAENPRLACRRRRARAWRRRHPHRAE